LDIYGGDGYTVNLGNNRQYAANLVSDLKSNNWIDERTRAIFAEFSVLNANTGLFSIYTRIFELPSTGGVFQWTQQESVQLYRYTGNSLTICSIS